jgi:hypothetical protein
MTNSYNPDTIKHAIIAYSFLMQTNQFTLGELAEQIIKHYDINNPRIYRIVQILTSANWINFVIRMPI